MIFVQLQIEQGPEPKRCYELEVSTDESGGLETTDQSQASKVPTRASLPDRAMFYKVWHVDNQEDLELFLDMAPVPLHFQPPFL